MTDINELLQILLRAYRDKGMTNQAIADMGGLTHGHVNRLLNGPSSNLGKVKLETLVKLFPELFTSIVQNVHADNGIGIANGDYATVNNAQSLDALRLEKSILDDDGICDSCKIKVLKLLKK